MFMQDNINKAIGNKRVVSKLNIITCNIQKLSSNESKLNSQF